MTSIFDGLLRDRCDHPSYQALHFPPSVLSIKKIQALDSKGNGGCWSYAWASAIFRSLCGISARSSSSGRTSLVCFFL